MVASGGGYAYGGVDRTPDLSPPALPPWGLPFAEGFWFVSFPFGEAEDQFFSSQNLRAGTTPISRAFRRVDLLVRGYEFVEGTFDVVFRGEETDGVVSFKGLPFARAAVFRTPGLPSVDQLGEAGAGRSSCSIRQSEVQWWSRTDQDAERVTQSELNATPENRVFECRPRRGGPSSSRRELFLWTELSSIGSIVD